MCLYVLYCFLNGPLPASCTDTTDAQHDSLEEHTESTTFQSALDPALDLAVLLVSCEVRSNGVRQVRHSAFPSRGFDQVGEPLLVSVKDGEVSHTTSNKTLADHSATGAGL